MRPRFGLARAAGADGESGQRQFAAVFPDKMQVTSSAARSARPRRRRSSRTPRRPPPGARKPRPARPRVGSETPGRPSRAPGDRGNELGVGRYCETLADCAGTADARLCTALFEPRFRVCTKRCDNSVDGGALCGAGASCRCDRRGCACLPETCWNNAPAECRAALGTIDQQCSRHCPH